ncbi:MAG: hypothetical protein MR543_11350 [Robinsoniella sp.]|nr:hypothetical protein [Robinsoniella sp.]
MHVNEKKIAFCGLLLAICEILLVLSKVIDVSTLFFLAAASFCTGVAVREYGLSLGFAFFVASELLGLILVPDKLYCLTYGMMAFYIWAREAIWRLLSKKNLRKNPSKLLWIAKYAVFNVMYIPAVILMPELFYKGTYSLGMRAMLLLGGQVILWIFDKAYCYFQDAVWGKYRRVLQ